MNNQQLNAQELHREIVRDVETAANIYTSVKYPKAKCLLIAFFGTLFFIGYAVFGFITQTQTFTDWGDVLWCLGTLAFFWVCGLLA